MAQLGHSSERNPLDTSCVWRETGFVLAPSDAVPSLGRVAPIVHTYRSGEIGLLVEAIGRAAGGRAELSEQEANRVTSLTERYLPTAPLGWLVGASASAVAAELATKEAAHA